MKLDLDLICATRKQKKLDLIFELVSKLLRKICAELKPKDLEIGRTLPKPPTKTTSK
jgi:hypothetical protein